MVMTDQGVVIRFNIASISVTSRATLGVKMIRLDDGAKVSSITKIMKTGEETQELAETEVDTEEAKDDSDSEEE